jgi:RNA polymerase sigma-70 factor (ECF subfamily)
VQPSDAQLLARVAAGGQREVFGMVIARYQKQIRTTLFRLTKGNLALVDDLAQETFLQAYLKIRGYKGHGSLGGWLSKIAFHSFLQYLRKEKKFDLLQDDHAAADPASHGDQIQSEIDLEKAMQTLGIHERIAIDLCLANGFSHSEASDIMEMPLGTVKSHVLRGKSKLKKLLEQRSNL